MVVRLFSLLINLIIPLPYFYTHHCAPLLPRFQFVSLHPGNIVTEVSRSLPAWLITLKKSVGYAILLTAAEGSDTTIFVATEPDIENGAYNTMSEWDQRVG